MVNDNIFKDVYISKNSFYRIFNPNVNPNDLIWHTDKCNRKIKIINDSEGWLFQFDNELPFTLSKNLEFVVYTNTYHRLIIDKPTSKLIIHIQEF